ncbi:MAG TPA: polysaccharide biosynthesis protein [Alphaproteobacteria bacterium]|nr:polysaccharide biosynthesis protein [Alphaproteobacteria bacterium]HAJ48146.1 polysaccharide biosynthesis protein [Alphaproteobacteria bacterium]
MIWQGIMRLLGAVLVVLTVSACAESAGSLGQAQNRLGPTPQAVDYTLGSEDKIKLTVFGEEKLSGEFLVDGSGVISLPLIGQVRAGGLTLRQFESAVTEALKKDYLKDPKVSAEVVNFRPIYVIGEVNKPGQYPYVSDMTVSKAVALANGYTYRANEGSVMVTRNGQTFKIEAGRTPILPGDEIRVPERFF